MDVTRAADAIPLGAELLSNAITGHAVRYMPRHLPYVSLQT